MRTGFASSALTAAVRNISVRNTAFTNIAGANKKIHLNRTLVQHAGVQTQRVAPIARKLLKSCHQGIVTLSNLYVEPGIHRGQKIHPTPGNGISFIMRLDPHEVDHIHLSTEDIQDANAAVWRGGLGFLPVRPAKKLPCKDLRALSEIATKMAVKLADGEPGLLAKGYDLNLMLNLSGQWDSVLTDLFPKLPPPILRIVDCP